MAHARFTPHRWRRTLQVTNLALAGLLVATGVVLLSSDREAQARVGSEARAGYERGRASGLRWRPPQPVASDAMTQIVWRFRDHNPGHWIFSGPLPPAPEAPDPQAPPTPDLSDDLASLGSVRMIAHDPAVATAVGFQFHATGKMLGFGPGEILRASHDDPARFRLTGVTRLAVHSYVLRYDVLQDGEVLLSKTYRYDAEDGLTLSAGGCIWPEKAGGAHDKSEAEVRIRIGATKELPRIEALRPTAHTNPLDRYDRVIEFDDLTHGWSRGRGIAALAESFKTAVAEDPTTKRILGLRITGMAKGLPAEKFDVRRGDILVSINDRLVQTREDAIRIARSLDPDSDDLVKVVIDRGGKRYTYRVDARDPHTKRKFAYFVRPK